LDGIVTIPFNQPMTRPNVPADADLGARFRPLFQRIAREAVRREQQRELPFEAIQWLREAGFGAIRVPKAYGGDGATIPQLFRLLVELAEADSNIPQILRAHFAFVEGRLTSKDQTARTLWLRRVSAGALVGAAMAERTDATENTVTLIRRDGHWILNGQKYYCTGTLYADWVAAAAVDGDEHVSVAVPATAPGVTREDDWDGFGQRLTGSGTTKFDHVRLDDEHIIRRIPTKEYRSESYLTAFYQLFHLAALAGIARAVLRDGTAFVQGRTRAFGVHGTSSPRSDPLVQRVVGRLASLSFAATTLVESVATAIEDTYQAALNDTADEALYAATDVKAFQAQQVVINLVLEATTLLFEVGGASATSETRRLDRYWRNARTLASHNPAIYRERAIGDYYLNGTAPREAWFAKQPAAVVTRAPVSEPVDELAGG
jgi:alkylation response protein AidB-like acyl-CoA dehydrogenase